MTLTEAFDTFRTTMRDDPEYAWSWHCNLAMPIMDSTGVSHEAANKAAARLMQHLFAIDTAANPHYATLVGPDVSANAHNGGEPHGR